MWYITATRKLAEKILTLNGYRVIDTIVWVKHRPTIGKYLTHQHESCFVALKTDSKYEELKAHYLLQVTSNVIFEATTFGS